MAKTHTIFEGVATALITPMTEDGVNYEQFGRLIDWQIEQGIDALVIAGTTGEGSTLSDEEHKECIRYAVEKVAGRVPVIAGTGSNDTEYGKQLTKFACEAGADACLVVTPYYNKATQGGLVKLFSEYAEVSSVPIIAYNYGADRRDRLEHTMSLGVRYGVGVMSVGTLIFWLFPEQLMALFSAPPEMVSMGIVALHIMSLNFPFAGFCIMRGAAFQALGKSVYSMNISLIRQLGVLLPMAWILGRIGGVTAVWWAFPIAEIAGTGMSVMYTRKVKREIIDNLDTAEL